MRGVVVVESDVEACEIPFVFFLNTRNQGFRRNAFLFSPQHNRGSVGVVGTDVVTLMPSHLLETGPNIGLDIFDQMPEVNRTIGIGQGAGDQYFSFLRHAAYSLHAAR